MAARYYKRKKFGCLRINMGPNGIGYSIGHKGLRYTVMSNGRTRITASIPKTGIRYTSEYKTNTRHKQESVDPIPVIVTLTCLALFILFGC